MVWVKEKSINICQSKFLALAIVGNASCKYAKFMNKITTILVFINIP